jgi:hypothetical protein
MFGIVCDKTCMEIKCHNSKIQEVAAFYSRLCNASFSKFCSCMYVQ